MKIKQMLIFALLLNRLMAATTACAQISIVDGDSLFLHGQEIRLSGIDAPEYKQWCYNGENKKYACGKSARKALVKLAAKDLQCKTLAVDKYKRKVAVCYSQGININKKMVENGWALAYKRYTSEYNDAENSAKINKRGIWQGRFMKPELYRILQKKSKKVCRNHKC